MIVPESPERKLGVVHRHVMGRRHATNAPSRPSVFRRFAVVAAALMFAAWCISPWWYTSVHYSGWGIGLSRGRFDIGHETGRDVILDGWYLQSWKTFAPWKWWFQFDAYSSPRLSHWELSVPLWIPIAISVAGLSKTPKNTAELLRNGKAVDAAAARAVRRAVASDRPVRASNRRASARPRSK